MEIYCLAVLETESWVLRYWLGWLLPRTVREESVPSPSPWLIDGHLLSVPHCHLPSVCVCPNSLVLEVYQSYWIRTHLNDLTLP